ncbi:MAG: hypothetical protein AAF384_16675 [Pseudomonadota bacterium]
MKDQIRKTISAIAFLTGLALGGLLAAQPAEAGIHLGYGKYGPTVSLGHHGYSPYRGYRHRYYKPRRYSRYGYGYKRYRPYGRGYQRYGYRY